MENKTNGLVYVLQMDRQCMPIRLVWDSCLGPEMLLVLLPGLRRCRIHKALLTNRDAGTLGENVMTCVKNTTFKMLQGSRHNSNTEQVRECTYVVKIPGHSIGFVISKKLGAGDIQCVPLFNYNTQKWRVTLQIHKGTHTLLHTKRSYIIP